MKISSRVLEFSLIVVVPSALAFAYVQTNGQTEDEKEAMLRQKYPDLVRQSQANRKPMHDFFMSMKNTNNAEKDKVFDDLMRKGKSNLDKRQGPNVGIEDTIQPVAKPAIVPIKEKNSKKDKAKDGSA